MTNSKKILNLTPINANSRVNWFPGHMHKSVQEIEKIKSQIDLIIEIKDARAPVASDNQELSQIFAQKPILKIYLKKDLADQLIDTKLSFCVFDKNVRTNIIRAIEQALKPKLDQALRKGMKNPILQVLVCGLPNLGKSTIINKLVQKNVARVADTPGLTKAFTRFRFHQNMWIYDTPGIFYRRVETDEIGYQLALIGAIKRDLIPLQKTLAYAYDFLLNNYSPLLKKLIQIDPPELFDDFILILCQQKKFIKKSNVWDVEKAMWYFYDLIRTGKIGLISWNLSNDKRS
ncbi:ribosome biogenesis GTPase A [Mycoplasmoides fastidiosum]|uniref:Ribosome biogenesis GTPase A n=1 Tax=Mycoplasmoides fastidiosum TaxID=92758 RepID=A0ABU0LYD8_9BACT|nr:ribosome biogenesis GTPase YlqF [Mycoplasmoides fastidiosum]MDQ0513721.1 ribosome biogenesis GTPase A [Mycoplasmoides fastidiosum]UUD37856.1 ribosome biogenesis GTPase YlqF [Mycoplasmoides fastidiosum]